MKNIAVLFPGQGSQYRGMREQLCTDFPVARRVFEEASDALHFDMQELCFATNLEQLTLTENAQPAILTASYAAYLVYREIFELQPTYLAGHSLGEYTALVASEALEFASAVRLVRRRGELMRDAGKGTMAAVNGCPATSVEAVCEKTRKEGANVVVANYNCSDQTVISGDHQGVDTVSRELEALNAKVIPLKVSAPFHSPLMVSAAEGMKAELESVVFGDFSVPVISNVFAKPYVDKKDIAPTLVQQITSSVRWSETIDFLAEAETDGIIDVGPKSVLKNLARKQSDFLWTASLDKKKDLEKTKNYLGSARENLIKRLLGIAVSYRNSATEYPKEVFEQYESVRRRLREIVEDGDFPRKSDLADAFVMFEELLSTKGVDKDVIEQERESLFATFTLRDLNLQDWTEVSS